MTAVRPLQVLPSTRMLPACSLRAASAACQGCLKSRLLFRQPVEFKIKSLYYNDLILNIAYKIKEAIQKLKFLDVCFPLRAAAPVQNLTYRQYTVVC